jgi:hypothetical protein
MKLRCLEGLYFDEYWRFTTLTLYTIRMSRFPTRFSAQFPSLLHYLIIIALQSDIRVSWSLIVSTLFAVDSSRLVNMTSESGMGQGVFPRLSFSTWGLVYCDLRLFMQRAVTDRIPKKDNASDGNGIILCSAWQRYRNICARGSYSMAKYGCVYVYYHFLF